MCKCICVFVYLCISHLIHGNVIFDILESHAFVLFIWKYQASIISVNNLYRTLNIRSSNIKYQNLSNIEYHPIKYWILKAITWPPDPTSNSPCTIRRRHSSLKIIFLENHFSLKINFPWKPFFLKTNFPWNPIFVENHFPWNPFSLNINFPSKTIFLENKCNCFY